ncbi:MAG: ABC transporter ATP-binding protein [Chloroflexi bacterium]|nr:ABC transporter ATP-binding protein [Chloroflexota bacterium]MCL5107834.1 ABC transporter ATP-binding protein [Chloroflexota bacterium]
MASIRLDDISRTFTDRPKGGLSNPRGMAWFGHLFSGGLAAATAGLKTEQPVRALDGVNLWVGQGETVSVVGPSGCGKTTLLRVVAGLEGPDSGRVYFDDEDVTGLPPAARRIGIVFQNYALYPHMTGKENVSFYLRMHHRQAEIEERVRVTAEMLGVGFEQLLAKKPPKLSPGQQQRVAIGRCITRDPSAFLFDEPLSNVDAKVRVQTRVVIKRLLSRFRITSLYVTHDQTEALALGDRIAVMRDGRIEQIGSYNQLYERPENLFVAGFLGIEPMSFFNGRLDGNQLQLQSGVSVELPGHVASVARQGAQLALGVRGKDVTLVKPTDGHGLRGTVDVVEVLPSERYQLVHLTVAGSNCQAQAPREQILRPGFVVGASINFQHVYLFEQASGARLWPR